MNMECFDRQLERIQLASGTGTLKELASLLGVGQAAITHARRRNKIPSSWLVTLMQYKGIYPEWILSGSGPVYAASPAGTMHYESGAEAAERKAYEEALRRIPSRMLADELVRRIAVSQGALVLNHCNGKEGI